MQLPKTISLILLSPSRKKLWRIKGGEKVKFCGEKRMHHLEFPLSPPGPSSSVCLATCTAWERSRNGRWVEGGRRECEGREWMDRVSTCCLYNYSWRHQHCQHCSRQSRWAHRHKTPPDTSNVSLHTDTCESDTHHRLLDVFLLQSNPIMGTCLTLGWRCQLFAAVNSATA